MTEDLVNVIERDIKEVVEAEIRKFLEHYEDCEKVDGIFTNEHLSIAQYDVLLHSLPCDIHRNIIITSTSIYEIPEITCWLEYEDEEKEIAIGYVKVVSALDKCFVKTYIDDYEIKNIAEKIVKEAEAGE